MVKKALALLVGIAVLGAALGVFGLFGPALVEAQSPAASRSLSPSPATVEPGGEITVTITLTDVDEGRVEETLPTGFAYVEESVSPDNIRVTTDSDDNQIKRFTLRGDNQFSYKVTASDTVDDYTFTGVLKAVIGGGDSVETVDVMGDSMVTVEAGAPTPSEEPSPSPDPSPEATGPMATRTVSPGTVTTGGQLTVTVNVSGLGSGGGRVEETLPSGFSYVMDSVNPTDILVTERAQTVRFTIRSTSRFTYRVNVMSQPDDYSIMGVLRDDQRNRYPMEDSPVTVQADTTGQPTASRTLSTMSVVPGGELTVTVAVSGLGGPGGRVEETLPTGFSYVEDSVMPSDVRVSMAGGAVRFTVRGTDQFSYKVMASDMDGSYSFMGVLRDDQKMEYAVTGDSAVAVGVVANRTLSATTVRPGAGLTVTITAGGYNSAGARIEETLPNGFSYMEDSVSEDDILVTMRDQTVRFTVRGTDMFTYGVTASNTPGTYTFMGVLRDADRTTHTIGGDNSVMVEAPATATPEPTPTRRPRSRGGGGGGGGGYAPPVATATPMPARVLSTPVATIVPTPTPIIVPTIVAPTAAPTPEPTAKPEPTAVPPTAIPTPRPTARVVVPTVAPTKPPEPTAMPKPTAAPTAVPPREVPPTAMVEPTEPPAPTATIAPTVAPVTPVTPDEDGMPTWLIILIIVIIVAVVIAAVGFYMIRMRR